MATQVASLFGLLSLRDEMTPALQGGRRSLQNFGSQLQSIGGQVSSLGGAMTAIGAPIAAVFGKAVQESTQFNASLTNIGAVLNLTQGEISSLGDELLAIGGARRAGPQAIAEAFYDIVGGVADSSTHMAILNAALDTAEAGSANLTATVQGMISAMNSYNFEADQAAYVSDIFTRTVGVGVGTMDEFVAAMGPILGLTASTGVSLTETGTAMGFLTTKGFSASQSATRLQAAITAIIKPNERMKDALAAAGLESGSAALANLGLVETLRRLAVATGGSTDELAAALGTTEALGAAMALTGEDFRGFAQDYAEGLNGATEAAKGIQNTSTQAQLDLLNAQMSELAISVGDAVVPALLQVVEAVRPIIDSVIEWVKENPELIAQIGMVAGALAVAGPILIAVGAAISGIGAIIGLVLSPIGLIVAAVAGLALAWETDFLGMRETLQPFVDWFVNEALPAVINFINTTVIPGIQNFIGWLGRIWSDVSPFLTNLFNWFVTDALPAIVGFINDTVIPGVQAFISILQDFWTQIQPGLDAFFNWVINDALPLVVDFIQNVVQPAIDLFISVLQGIWEVVGPPLTDLFNWFMENGLPVITNLVQTFMDTIITPFINLLKGIWEAVQPALENLKTLFQNTIGWVIDNVLNPALNAINNVINAWNSLQGNVGAGVGGVTGIAGGLASGQFGVGDVWAAVRAEFGFASGAFNVPRPMVAQLHTGEAVLSAPDAEQWRRGGGNGSGVQIGTVNVYGNSYQEGREAADGFKQRIEELYAGRGN